MRPISLTRTPPAVAALRGDGWWSDHTLGDRLRFLAATSPDKLALVDARERFTFAEYLQEVIGLAESLSERGLKPGDRLGIALSNRVEFPITRLAAAEVGAVSILLNSSWQPGELVAAADQAGCDAVVALDRHGDARVEQALEGSVAAGGPMKWFSVLGAFDEKLEFTRLRKRSVDLDSGRFSRTRATAFEVDDVLFTSGTTGTPKGVMSCQARWIAMCEAQRGAGDLGPEDVGAVISPVGGAIGYLKSVVLGLATGGTIVLVEDAEASNVLATIERERVTWLASLPALTARLLRLVRSQRSEGNESDLSSLRLVFNGGAPMPAALARELHELMNVFVMTAIGSTESGAPAGTGIGDTLDQQCDTVGKAHPGSEMALLVSGQVEASGDGELLSRGSMLFDGYLDDPVSTLALFSGDWIRHHDRATIGPDGYIVFGGRLDDVINRGGTKVSPLQVERACSEHPAISACAAFGVDDEDLGSRVGLAAVLGAGEQLDLDELREFLSVRAVPRSQRPEYLRLVAALPLGPTGKVDRRKLSNL